MCKIRQRIGITVVDTKKNKLLGAVVWFAIIVTLTAIFVFSNMASDASESVSAPLIDKTNEFVASHIVTDLGERPANDRHILEEKVTVFVRKSAHAFEYFCLGFLVFLRFYLYGVDRFRSGGLAMCVCLLLAIADEYHQTFVPGRCGCLSDALIDFCGIVVGILICLAILLIVSHKRERKAKRGLPAA